MREMQRRFKECDAHSFFVLYKSEPNRFNKTRQPTSTLYIYISYTLYILCRSRFVAAGTPDHFQPQIFLYVSLCLKGCVDIFHQIFRDCRAEKNVSHDIIRYHEQHNIYLFKGDSARWFYFYVLPLKSNPAFYMQRLWKPPSRT